MSQQAAQNATTYEYGVTPPISKDGPTPKELTLAVDLMAELKAQGTIESEEESRLREAVLEHATALVKEFVYQACIRRNLSKAAAKAAGGKIYTFGSYRLGAHGPGSDIDTLVVAPKYVDRQDFIELFFSILQKDSWVKNVLAVPNAYVPVIKSEIRGIAIDFTFARLALSVIPEDLELKDDNLLMNLDERCVRGLNGSRCTDDILRLVPNVHVFRDALRAIRFWAQRRAIYSKVNGFLGGVAWAVLVARVCQLYPKGNSATIVRRFFLIMSLWNWPHPVVLKKEEDQTLNMRVWNPKADSISS